ncbi:protein FAM174C [Salarias fasciatus]|nr:uncharacterized membrane protein C19orf24 homolog [Salarias fasciatus]
MSFHGLLSVGVVLICCLSLCLSAAEDRSTTAALRSAAAATANSSSSGVVTNSTHGNGKGLFNDINVNSSMIQRALYVLIGFTMIGVLYFLVRAVRLKKPVHRKKYGLLAEYEDSVEMDAMESDEDDTLYEARSLRR